VVAGAGAGAMALTDPMVDPRGGALTVGLGLIEGLAVFTHYGDVAEDAHGEKLHRSVLLAPAGVPVADAAGEGPAHAEIEEAAADLSLKRGTGFAVSVVGIMLAEQTLMNAGVLIVAANAGSKAGLTVGITGFVFNVLLIVRAPLQLFQAIQTSILPHLASLEARESAEEFHRAIRTTIKVIAAFASAVAIGLLAIGPFVMTALLGDKGFHYGRIGLALVGIGMGLHLAAGTLNQAALARSRAPLAAVAWLTSAALFVAFMLSGAISNQVTRVEVSYFTAALILCGLLWAVYRRGSAPAAAQAAVSKGAAVRRRRPSH